MWVITKDKLFEDSVKEYGKCNFTSSVGVSSRKYDGRKLEHRFRMKDDDGIIYYYGTCSNDSSFAPLDDFGMPDSGCTSIEYYNKDKKKWEVL